MTTNLNDSSFFLRAVACSISSRFFDCKIISTQAFKTSVLRCFNANKDRALLDHMVGFNFFSVIGDSLEISASKFQRLIL